MTALLIVLVLLALLGVLGLVVKGLLWLFFVAVVVFVASSIYGWVKFKTRSNT